MPSSPHLNLTDGLVQSSFLIQAVMRRVAQRHDLSVVQTRLLGVLRDRQPGILELADHLGLDKSSVTGLVDRAERRDLVERIARPEDRRAIRVVLTRTGRSLATRFASELGEELLAVAAGLTDAQRRQLSSLLSKVVQDDPNAVDAPDRS